MKRAREASQAIEVLTHLRVQNADGEGGCFKKQVARECFGVQTYTHTHTERERGFNFNAAHRRGISVVKLQGMPLLPTAAMVWLP